MSASPVDPKRCPLCGDDNDCGAARGAATCWCFESKVPAEVLERVPAAAKGVACVCERCASGRNAGEQRVTLDRPTRPR
jgi:hypothetical protein